MAPQVLVFFKQRQQKLEPRQAVQVETALGFIESQISSVYIPGSVVTIDETMVPWLGRLSFKKYIPGKAHKYGVKIYKLAATNGYT